MERAQSHDINYTTGNDVCSPQRLPPPFILVLHTLAFHLTVESIGLILPVQRKAAFPWESPTLPVAHLFL